MGGVASGKSHGKSIEQQLHLDQLHAQEQLHSSVESLVNASERRQIASALQAKDRRQAHVKWTKRLQGTHRASERRSLAS